jgi:capsular exopolysaccharide synthesis family protein
MIYPGNPILAEIQRLHEEAQTGVLTLTGEGKERLDIFFREGMIEAASSNSAAERLGDYLVKGGHVPARELTAVHSEAQKQKIVFGEAVVRRNLADQTYVSAAVRNQSMDLLERALKGAFSVNCFTPLLRSYFAPARISFQHMILELARNGPFSFESGPEASIAVSVKTDLQLFPWRPEEIFVLNELKQARTFASLMSSTRFNEKSLRKIVGVLVALGVVENVADTEVSKAETSVAVRNEAFAFEHLIPVVTDAALNEKLTIAQTESSVTSEQFRNLKVHLRESDSQVRLKVFTISSPEAQDGKSFVSLNLAFSFSKDPGRRVIIIDCDFRDPSLAKSLGLASEPGLLQYLENPSLSPYCFVRRLENLYFMTTGGVASNPIEILSMQKMKQLIERLKNDFDTIILDAPPYSPIADARIVTGLSDALIMVVRHGRTSYSAADHAFNAVDRNKLVGVVFNDVKPLPFRQYAHSGYYADRKKELVYSAPATDSQRATTYLEP